MSRSVTMILIGLAVVLAAAVIALLAWAIGSSYFTGADQGTPVVVVTTTVPAATVPTATFSPTPTITATLTATGTAVPATATATATATQTPGNFPVVTAVPASCTNSAALVADVTVPDGSQIAPNTGFIKTWRIQNTGTCTWDSRYRLVHAGGHLLGAITNSFSLPGNVAPGQTIDLSVSLVSPAAPNTYQGDWKLQNSQGQFFGVGRNSGPFWVKIVVPAPQATIISGLVYQDLNQNGSYDNGEVLMGNREIWLIPGSACQVSANPIATAFSGGDGRYTLSGNYSGSYCVGLRGNNGLDDVHGIAIAAGQTMNTINLRAQSANATITGWLWNDYCLTNEAGDALDGDCVADGNGDFYADGMVQPTEGYIPGVTILLQWGPCANNTAVPVSATTDASGKYTFANLLPGTYCVFMNAAEGGNAAKLLPGDWTFPARGIWYHEIAVQTGELVTPVNFGWDFQLN